MPCVLVFPPRSNRPGFQSNRICFSKLAMIESRYAISPGSGFSSAIFKPSFGRFRLIKAVTRLAIGSRSTASNAGRKNGSNRRSTCTRAVDALASQFKNEEPVLAFGMGWSVFEFKASPSKGGESEIRQLRNACLKKDGTSSGVLLRRIHASLQDRKSTRLNSSHLAISYAV